MGCVLHAPCNRVSAGHELIKKLGGDGQTVTASQGEDFALVAEGCSHDDGLEAELLVVGVDLRHADDAWVGSAREGLQGSVSAAKYPMFNHTLHIKRTQCRGDACD